MIEVTMRMAMPAHIPPGEYPAKVTMLPTGDVRVVLDEASVKAALSRRLMTFVAPDIVFASRKPHQPIIHVSQKPATLLSREEYVHQVCDETGVVVVETFHATLADAMRAAAASMSGYGPSVPWIMIEPTPF